MLPKRLIAIAINPTNPKNIAVVSNDETVAPHGTWKAYSMDGGAMNMSEQPDACETLIPALCAAPVDPEVCTC